MLVVVTLLGATMTVATPAIAGGENQALPPDLKLLVRGGGWGHGHGMSQYGARAAAESGMVATQILRHYYEGVSIEDVGNPKIRVLLASSRSIVVGGPESYTVRWKGGEVIRLRTDTHPYTRVRATDDGVAVARGSSPDGPWQNAARGTGHVRITADDGPAVPVWRSGRIEYFRDTIEAYRRSASTIYLINELWLNRYLFGVVPREMPASWDWRALRAQSIAARSYSLWKRGSVGSSASYHICATTACQVYMGYGRRADAGAPLEVLEHDRTNDAITATSGQAMVDPDEGPIFAEYHSSSGGHTSQGSRPYLAPVDDPYDATHSPYHRWQDKVAVSEIESHWPALGRLVSVVVSARDGEGPFGGRVKTLTLVGTERDLSVSGDTFRFAMGLRSTLFTIDLYAAEQAAPIQEVALAPGTSAPVEVLIRNTGTAKWPVGENVVLATDPAGRSSQYRSDTWLSSTNASGITADVTGGNDMVRRGEVAAIRFTITAPVGVTPGLYSEAFRMVAEGTTRFGPTVRVPIRLGFDGAGHLGGNLLDDPSFEILEGTEVAAWTRVAGTTPAVSPAAIDGANALALPASADRPTRVRQTLTKKGWKGNRFILSAWQRSDARGGGRSWARLALHHPDGSTTLGTVEFPGGTHGWRFGQAAVVAPARFTSMDVTLVTVDQTGEVSFDRVGVVRQHARNGGFELRSADWTIVGGGPGRVVGRVRHGRASLRLDGSTGRTVFARQYRPGVTGRRGQLVRVSGWSRSERTSASGGPVQIRVRLRHADGTRSWHALAFPRAPHDWVYAETAIVAPKDFTRVDLYARVKNQTGAAWFDEIVLGKGGAASLAANGSFELGAPVPGEWTLLGTGTDGAQVSSDGRRGHASLRVSGAPTQNRYARQMLPLGGGAGDRFRLSGWSKTVGSNPEGGPVRIWARVYHADGTYTGTFLDFARGAHDWTYGERVVTTAKPYVAVRVYGRFAQQTGDAWFDAIRFVPA